MKKGSMIGLETLYESDILPQLDVILVHGLDGDAVESWKADDGTLWPVDLLPQKLPNTRVMTFGYRGTIQDTSYLGTVEDHGLSLIWWLSQKREAAHEEIRPIIFVCHNLGGIIVKKTLLLAKGHCDTRILNLFQSTYGVIFFSTPHHGVNPEIWKKLMRSIVENSKPTEQPIPPTSQILQEIEHGSKELDQISQAFRLISDVQYVSFREGLTFPELGTVLVGKDSSVMHNPMEFPPIMIPRHHFDMCRYGRDPGDRKIFEMVSEAIRRIEKESPKAKYFGDIGRVALRSLGVEELRTKPLAIKRTEGTCGWITQKPPFMTWQKSETKTNQLWILGGLGCGKTHLASRVAELEAAGGRVVAECYVEEISERYRTGKSVLLFLLHKVLTSCPSLINKFMVKEYHSRRGRDEIWDIDTIKRVWPEVMVGAVQISALTLIVDGADKCEDDLNSLFHCLQLSNKQITRIGRIRFLILSRECAAFQTHGSSPNATTYQITEADTRADIKLTIMEKLQKSSLGHQYTQRVKKLMKNKIADGAQGMYLWADIMVEDTTRALLSEGEMEDRLQSLPRGLMELYDSILGRIGRDPDKKSFLRKVLFWTTFRHEALMTHELRVGLALSTLTEKRGSMSIDEKSIMRFLPAINVKLAVNYLCGHLVKISSDRVNLVHDSLKEFLVTQPQVLRKMSSDIVHHEDHFFEEDKSHKVMGDFCVAYLLMPQFEDSGTPYENTPSGPALWEKKVSDRIKSHKFVRYASLGWDTHLRLSNEPFSITNNGDSDQRVLLDLKNPQAICWTEVWWLIRNWRRTKQDYPGHLCSLEDILGRNAIGRSPRKSTPNRSRRPPPRDLHKSGTKTQRPRENPTSPREIARQTGGSVPQQPTAESKATERLFEEGDPKEQSGRKDHKRRPVGTVSTPNTPRSADQKTFPWTTAGGSGSKREPSGGVLEGFDELSTASGSIRSPDRGASPEGRSRQSNDPVKQVSRSEGSMERISSASGTSTARQDNQSEGGIGGRRTASRTSTAKQGNQAERMLYLDATAMSQQQDEVIFATVATAGNIPTFDYDDESDLDPSTSLPTSGKNLPKDSKRRNRGPKIAEARNRHAPRTDDEPERLDNIAQRLHATDSADIAELPELQGGREGEETENHGAGQSRNHMSKPAYHTSPQPSGQGSLDSPELAHNRQHGKSSANRGLIPPKDKSKSTYNPVKASEKALQRDGNLLEQAHSRSAIPIGDKDRQGHLDTQHPDHESKSASTTPFTTSGTGPLQFSERPMEDRRVLGNMPAGRQSPVESIGTPLPTGSHLGGPGVVKRRRYDEPKGSNETMENMVYQSDNEGDDCWGCFRRMFAGKSKAPKQR